MKKYLSDLERFGITSSDYLTAKKTLAKKFMTEPVERDVIWFLYNSALTNAMHKNDFAKLGEIYYSMGIFINDEGKNPFIYLKESQKNTIIMLRNKKVLKGVQILAQGCHECQSQNKKIYSIKEALKEMPLPNKNCNFKLNKGKFPFCRCCYLPVIDDTY